MDKDWGVLSEFTNRGFEFDGRVGFSNVIGIRARDARVNYFDDWLGVVVKQEHDEWKVKLWKGTTRPGKDSLLKPVNAHGTAILVPGQYEDTYGFGIYKGYPALKQERPVRVFRDATLDEKWDTKDAKIEEGLFGIHIHRAGFWSKVVGPYSAGCQVFQKYADYEEFILNIRDSWVGGQDKFTYTLIEI